MSIRLPRPPGRPRRAASPATARPAEPAASPVAPAPAPRPAPPLSPRRLRKLAKRNARSRYQGPPEGEVYVASQLQALGAELTRLRRNDQALRGAQVDAAATAFALQDVTEEVARTLARTRDAVAAAASVAATVDDPVLAARWSAGSLAITERRAADHDLSVARYADAHAARTLDAVGGQLIDRLAESAAAGLVPINAYLTAFNEARAQAGRDPIGSLGDEWVHRLVRQAFRAIDLSGSHEEDA